VASRTLVRALAPLGGLRCERARYRAVVEQTIAITPLPDRCGKLGSAGVVGSSEGRQGVRSGSARVPSRQVDTATRSCPRSGRSLEGADSPEWSSRRETSSFAVAQGGGARLLLRRRFWFGGDPLSTTSVEWYDYVGGREAPPLTDPHPNPFPSLGARSAPSPGAPRVFSRRKRIGCFSARRRGRAAAHLLRDRLAARRSMAWSRSGSRALARARFDRAGPFVSLSVVMLAAGGTTTVAAASLPKAEK